MSTLRIVRSCDGTSLAVREVGAGPSVLLLHGAMQTSRNLSALARGLSTSFRVHTPDRRGRGDSGPLGAGYGLDREIEDLDVLLKETGARVVFGLSGGGLIALSAACVLDGLERLAVYEPPLTCHDVDAAAWVPRYLREVDRGGLASAMATIVGGTGDVGVVTSLPRAVLTPLFWLAIRAEATKGAADHMPIRDLIPTVRFDAQLQREASARLETFAKIRCDTLLMGGDRSHRTLRAGLDALAVRLPRATRVRFPGAGHLAADNGGRPEDVANILLAFFRRNGL